MAIRNPSEDPLEKLAARIADDEPVDWRAAGNDKANADPIIAGMRELEQVMQGFRHAQISNGKDTPRVSRFKFGSLTVIEPLGSGSQGEVWRAYDPLLDLQVALKLRKIESGVLSHQFLEEARHLARVRQANIVSVYGAAVHDGRAGIWTELIRGTSLAELLARHGPFPIEDVRAIGVDLCHALAAVHRHGLVHGDIKLENVMRDVSGRIVLMDFGAAREQDRAQSSVVSGSLHYLAPEVLRGASPSVSSDLYALGVLLFRLLTGEYPYRVATLADLLHAHDAQTRVSLADARKDVPSWLIRAIDAALSTDPARRPASAIAFAATLVVPAPRRVWPAVAAAGIVVVAAAAVWSLLHPAAAAWETDVAFRRGGTTITDGATIALGDRLTLSFHSNRDAYLYVFDDDGSAQAAVLFPLQDVAPANPLAGGSEHQLPGRHGMQVLSWQVSSDSLRDSFVVVACDQPQPQLENAITAWRHAQLETSRGTLMLAPAPVEEAISSVALRDALAALPADEARVRRWHYTFPHQAFAPRNN
jgi:eukaryotic-like serine/threonine-protein kinase